MDPIPFRNILGIPHFGYNCGNSTQQALVPPKIQMQWAIVMDILTALALLVRIDINEMLIIFMVMGSRKLGFISHYHYRHTIRKLR
jgi:hypothetical protein